MLEGFISVELLGRGAQPLAPLDPIEAPPAAIIEATDAVESWAGRDSLFGDVDP